MNNETTTNKQEIAAFWQAYCQSIGQRLTEPDAWAFGDTGEMADELAALVVTGKKTATTSAYQSDDEGDYATGGQYDIVLDGRNKPVAIIQNVVSELMTYEQVSAEHAYHEGEGDRSLNYWRRVHEAFFREEGQREGYQFSTQLTVSCEVFELKATRSTLATYLEAE